MATNLQAEVLAYEGFDSSVYTDGTNLSGQGSGSGTGFTGDWGAPTTDGGDYWLNTDTTSATAYYEASTGQASYTDANSQSLSTTSGQATFTGDGTEVSLQRFATTGVYASEPLYFSVLITLSDSASSSGILIGAASSSSSSRQFQFGFTSDNELTAMGMGWNSTSTATDPDAGDVSYSAGTYLLVAKLTNGASSTDTLELWINPLLGDESGSGTADFILSGGEFFVSNNGSWSIDGITIDVDGEGSVTIDELYMGTSWEDVTPSAIPEPSTLFIPALTFFSLGMIRRRKHA
jgi:hypothetical protein